ncbi:uncharacterized protein DUF2029 [Humibacillus xanthopallidus]|uniref:Uncharacterized protein DUF2029 n=2 Tax=Humibacillus xanthopallidus TaxID=412689 RepID=A0A543I1T0_9MICO|nr:uncharacterized protein DUF2029 [Humibacillus xanthopallidus]
MAGTGYARDRAVTLAAIALARCDSLLTRERLRVYPVLLLSIWLLMYAIVAHTSPDWVALPDFVARWTGGRLLLDGHAEALYDPAVQSELQATELHTTALSYFVSPPFVALAMLPFALLPYAVAAALWTVLSIAALLCSLALLRPMAPSVIRRHWRRTLALATAFYATLELLGSGQDTAFVLLAVCGAIRLLSLGREGLAGAVLALGLAKPQLVFLAPLLLVAQRRWRAVTAFVAAGAALLLMSIWIVGLDGVVDWLTLPTSPLYASEVQQGQAWKAVSVSAFITGLAPLSLGAWWTAAAYVIGLAACYPTLRAVGRQSRSGSLVSWTIILMATAVASPHFMLYDLVLLLPALWGLAEIAWKPTTRGLVAVVFVIAWLVAPLHTVTSPLGWPLSILGTAWIAVPLCLLWWTLITAKPTGFGSLSGDTR